MESLSNTLHAFFPASTGACLGDVLVRPLGGEWVLRQKMEESQMRVGKRVWLIFLRARRYTQSR
nr:hypothetical protein MFMH1_17500 [Myxococcus sp. MH1]